MNKIRIVTDSTADLPQEFVERYQITVLPLRVVINGESYRDRIDIDNETYYDKLQQLSELPTTSQPAPAEFAEIYRNLAAEGAEHILSIHLASELSGTLQGAKLAAGIVSDQVEVVALDSRTATMGLGLVVLAAAQAVAEGKTFADTVALTETVIQRSNLFFLLDSLDNLQKGGRIGMAGYLVGSLLNIKPILNLHDGVIHAHEKVRGNKGNKAMDRMIDVIIEHLEPGKKVYCAVGYCDNLPVAQQMVAKLQERMDCDAYNYMQIGNVVITHIGMGAFGLAFYQL